MRWIGSVKSLDSIMLSCLSPRRPCCGPKAAVSRTPACASASSECASACVTEAGCASSATRRFASGLRSAGSSSSRSIPNFTDLERESRAVVKVRLARRMPQRPVRERARRVLDHRGEADEELAVRVRGQARGELEPRVAARDGDARIRDGERASFAIALEGVSRPFAGRGKVEFAVAGAAVAPDEDLAAGVLPKLLADLGRARWRDAQRIDFAFQRKRDPQRALRVALDRNGDAAQRGAWTGGMTLERGGRHGQPSLSCAS